MVPPPGHLSSDILQSGPTRRNACNRQNWPTHDYYGRIRRSMAPADGKSDCLAVQSDRSQVMTGIMMLRGTSARLIAVELADHDDPWFVIPIVDGIEQGLPAVRIKP